MDELPILFLCLSPLPAELAEYPVSREAGMGLGLPRSRQIAGPFPVFRFFHHLCPNGIQDHVPAYFKKMAVFLDQDGLVPALEQVSGPAVPFVEELGIHSVQLAHAYGQVPVRGFDEKMIMIGHEAVGVADPVVAFVDVLEGVQKVLAVMVILEDWFLFVAA
mgnify:CR=1 FL=1